METPIQLGTILRRLAISQEEIKAVWTNKCTQMPILPLPSVHQALYNLLGGSTNLASLSSLELGKRSVDCEPQMQGDGGDIRGNPLSQSG